MKFIKDLGMLYANEDSKQKIHYALYECPSCNNFYKMRMYDVKRRSTKSCRSCSTTVRKTIHGEYGTPLHSKWASMKQRCNDKNCKSYPNYGGRGITVCSDWDEYVNFRKWALSIGYKDGLQIDRIDNDSGYFPDNCRFVTQTTNAQNKRLLSVRNKSGYRGVCFINRDNIFVATIRANGKKHNLKWSKNIMDCVHAYDRYVIDNNLEHPTNFEKEYYE